MSILRFIKSYVFRLNLVGFLAYDLCVINDIDIRLVLVFISC